MLFKEYNRLLIFFEKLIFFITYKSFRRKKEYKITLQLKI